jgi:hypothetical protein
MNRSTLLGLAAAILLPVGSAQAATVSGTVAAGQGYTVLAMAPSGQSTVAKVAANGRFSLKIKGAGSTLQLVTPAGRYFGPVVLGRAGKKAVVALSAKGGTLGKLKLKAGFAAVKAPKKAVSRKGAVRTAKNGGPLGAGKLGFVRMTGKSRAVASAAGDGPGAGGDPDKDGIPSTFDADDNGNYTMDGVDPQTAKTSTAGLFSDVQTMMARSINANAGGISTAQVDQFISDNLSLNFYLDPNYARGATIKSVDVDCGALVYCRPGDGTAIMGDGGNSPTGVQNQRWTSLDANRDGFPDIPVNANADQSHGEIHSIEIRPSVGSADIHAGDLYQIRFTTPGGVLTIPTALSLYFASSPALAVYDAGSGPVNISYPADNSTPGSDGNPLMMTGDQITMTFWRPQRAGMGSEPAFMDMGHLRYGVPIALDGREVQCGASRYSGLSPTLAPAGGSSDSIYNNLFPLQDAADDAAPSSANVLRFTLDVGGCLRANGIDPTGKQIRLPLEAVDESRPGGTDRTAQTIAVCLPGCTPPSQGGPQTGGSGGGPGTGEKADLAVSNVVGSPVDASCQLTIRIENRGTAMASPSRARVQVSGGFDGVVEFQNVAAGATADQVTTIPGACAGREATVTADEAGTVDEYSETNNVLVKTL